MPIFTSPSEHTYRSPFSRAEQTVAVWLAHTVLLVVVILLMLIGLDRSPPSLFLLVEAAIWLTFATLLLRYESLLAFLDPLLPESQFSRLFTLWRQRGVGWALVAAFVLQFVAITPLITETGGPLQSPFSQFILAFAVFGPLLANSVRTVLLTLFLSIGYYAGLVAYYGYGEASDRPAPWVYVAVTSVIVGVAVGLTLLNRLDADRQGVGIESPAADEHDGRG